MKRTMWGIPLAVALAAALLTACGGDDNTAKSTPNASATTPASSPSAAASAKNDATTVDAKTTPAVTTTAAPSSTAAATPSATATNATTPPATAAAATPTPVPPTPTPAPPTPTPTEAGPALPASAEVGISSQSNRFIPATVHVAVGGQVHWQWSGDNFHDVTATGFDGHPDTVKSADFTVTFPSSGTFTYVCSVHKATGMVGTIVVGS